jgi:hypothetical protein
MQMKRIKLEKIFDQSRWSRSHGMGTRSSYRSKNTRGKLEKLWDGGAFYTNGAQGRNFADGLLIKLNVARINGRTREANYIIPKTEPST